MLRLSPQWQRGLLKKNPNYEQQAYQQEKRSRDADHVAQLVHHIHTLRLRAAPLRGLSASQLQALLAQRGL
ncbi:hypothetical protein Q6256_28145, partial [Klebsiella pneumoniae]|nr:hypothetical protein [Klebsiella pneumoniae]